MPGTGSQKKERASKKTEKMIKLLEIFVCILIGVVLGFIYFGGLWLTVRKLLFYRKSAVLVLLSFLIRNGFLIFALFLIGRKGEWVNLIFVLIGIIGTRWMFFKRLDLAKPSRNCIERG